MASIEVGRAIAREIAEHTVTCARATADRITTGDEIASSDTLESLEPWVGRLHAKLSDAGLLNDRAFLDDLRDMLVHTALSSAWGFFTWHDGAWGTVDDNLCLAVGDGDPLPFGPMHDIFREEFDAKLARAGDD